MVNLIGQLCSQILTVDYNRNKTIKFQIVRNRGKPNLLTRDNLTG